MFLFLFCFQIRHQGRNQNGRSISFSKPFTVRDPFEFAAAGQNLPQQRREKIKKFPDMAPVFNLQEMLEAEAEKLRLKGIHLLLPPPHIVTHNMSHEI